MLYKDIIKKIFDNDMTKVDITRKVCDVASIAKDDYIDNIDIKESLKIFLVKLEYHIKDKTVKDLDSKNLIKDFLRSDKKLYQEIEVIIHCFSVAAVKLSVESSVESLVSRYEKHFDKARQLTEENANEEMLIAENGPIPVRADPLIKRALDRFFKDNNEQQSGRRHFTVGKVIKDQ